MGLDIAAPKTPAMEKKGGNGTFIPDVNRLCVTTGTSLICEKKVHLGQNLALLRSLAGADLSRFLDTADDAH
jgi:hypothetical protein